MKKLIVIFIISVFISGLQAQDFSFWYDGIERTYTVSLPSGYDPGNEYPMVVNMHGLGSNAFQQRLYSAFDLVADTAGVIVVYPNGVANQWNVYQTTGVDDVGFISALIDTMAANFSPDLNRVYATGMSMGGFMSYRLACELETRIAAIASVTGLLAFYPCEPSRPVPILQMHGTEDGTVPYSGVPKTIGHWVTHNACPEEPVVTELPNIDTTDNSTVTLTTFSPCEMESEVLLYTINGGEHTWPGAPIVIGVTNYDINASSEIWNFFKKYTLDSFTGIFGPYHQSLELNIYPMPINEYAVIQIPVNAASSWELRLFDLAGKIVRNEHVPQGNQLTFIRNGLKSGMYVLELNSGSYLFRKKIVLQ